MLPQLHSVPGPWSGKLFIVARPRGGDWLEDEIAGWRQAQLDVVISMLEEEEAGELGLAREGELASVAGIRFLSHATPDQGLPASFADTAALIARIVDVLREGQRVAVHCRQSIGRAGLFAAGALIVAGVDAEQAIEIASMSRGMPVPETEAQRQWLHQLASSAGKLLI